MGSPIYGDGKLAVINYQERALDEQDECPYRKPTQVDEEKILRRSKEPSLRNSAK